MAVGRRLPSSNILRVCLNSSAVRVVRGCRGPVGGLRVWVAADRLEPADAASLSTPNQAAVTAVHVRKMLTAPTELNLLGKRVDEALDALAKFLDDALLAGHQTVRIVHGKGTGKLRQAVHDYLRAHPQVRAFELAPFAQGGDGATIVYLKQ